MEVFLFATGPKAARVGGHVAAEPFGSASESMCDPAIHAGGKASSSRRKAERIAAARESMKEAAVSGGAAAGHNVTVPVSEKYFSKK